MPAGVASSAPVLRIGELAARSGFTAKTLRYYEDIGLLRPTDRSESGYRLYREDALARLRFVRRSQGLGLRLEDIKQILDIADEGRVPCEHVVAVVDRELASVAKQMARLKALRGELTGLRTRLIHALESGSVRGGGACPCFEETPENSGDEKTELAP